MLYLLKIIFYTISAIVLNISEARSNTTPIICYEVECTGCVPLSFLSNISNNCTSVIPKKARPHPTKDAFVKLFLRQILENIAVVIMTPPREICHTEPAIKFNEIYASAEASKSMIPGIKGK